MPLTMKKILQSTPENRKEGAEGVGIAGIKVGKSKDGYPKVMAKTTSKTNVKKGTPIPKDSRTIYITSIEVFPKKTVKLSCSCSDFMYTWEWVLASKGAADIEYSNGEEPGPRNPTHQVGCCKHLVALANKLIEKGKL